MRSLANTSIALALTPLLLGCNQPSTPTTTETPRIDVTARGEQFLLDTEPADAVGVTQMRQDAQDGDAVAVAGRIGGSGDPWVEGRAAFSIVDPSLKACSDIEGDTCQKPWDYCCETEHLPDATLLVKLVDDAGDLLATDARELLKVKELQTVVVQGIAKRDDAGNVTVLAQGIHVRP